MKICPKCSTNKDATEFYIRRNGTELSSYCKLCTNNQTLERQRQLKKQAVQYKGGKCIICNYSKYLGALEFHHLDPNEKDFSLGNCKLTSFEKVRFELDKCVLLCANCHREVHAGLIVLSN